jgi:hypothetical protein
MCHQCRRKRRWRRLVQPHDLKGVAEGAGTGAAWDIMEHLTGLVRQPTVVMWRGRVMTPVSAVIAVEDVRSTMVVAAVSEATGLPHNSGAVAAWYSAVAIRSVAVARAWSGGSMRRQHL